MKTCLISAALLPAAAAANAEPTAYTIDPTRTFPSFEADHMGISVWRGKLNKSRGKVLYDKATGTGSVEIVTRPLTLTVHTLKCIHHPMLKRDYCGADASGSFNREDFGLSAGQDYGFKMNVDLRIQVEAIAQPRQAEDRRLQR